MRLIRFRQILLAARNKPLYRDVLRSAGLDSVQAIKKLRSVEEALYNLPHQTFDAFRAQAPGTEDFPRLPLQRLLSPIAGIRAAVLGAKFNESPLVRFFQAERAFDIQRFDPGLIAAPIDVLTRWARGAAVGLTIPFAERAIVAFTNLGDGPLRDEVRDLLWRTFDAPIFEQWRAADGSVVAWECEAHDGMHIVESRLLVEQNSDRTLLLTSLADQQRPMLRMLADFTGRLEYERCGCGNTSARLCDIAVMKLKVVLAAAAS